MIMMFPLAEYITIWDHRVKDAAYVPVELTVGNSNTPYLAYSMPYKVKISRVLTQSDKRLI